HLFSYLEAILRVYNRFGRRDNKFKARIKILVKELGKEKFTKMVETEWAAIRDHLNLDLQELERIKEFFQPPPYESLADDPMLAEKTAEDSRFGAWFRHNTHSHKVPGY